MRQQKRHSGLLAEAAPQAAPAEPPPGAEPRRRRLPSKPRPAADEAPAKGAKEAEAPRRRRKPAAANEQPAPEQQQPPAAGEPAPALTKRQKVMQFVHAKPAVVTPAAKGALSFEADWHDHCETPFEAFRDVEPLLFQLAARLGRTKATLRCA